MTTLDIDWTKIGQALAESGMDAHDGVLPPVDVAYSFLLDNPECFSDHDEWPADMPQTPPVELMAAYGGEGETTADTFQPTDQDIRRGTTEPTDQDMRRLAREAE